MVLPKFSLVVAIFGASVVAIPTITYPLNSQLPPVGRPSVPYQYTFPGSTFSSTLPLTYSLSSGPSWLSLDSQTHTLSGTPSSSDVGSETITAVPISITASDATGSATLNATLVICKNPAPVVNMPSSAQLQSTGVFSAPETLLYHPSTPFQFNFQPNTFLVNGGSSGLSYYAVTTDNTPLPSWIKFDGASLSFTGQTPDYQSLIQPPQNFGIQLVASDVQGFAGASLSFDIEVGIHLFAFSNGYLTANASVGDVFDFNGLAGNLQLDGQPATSSNITSVTAETPSWLTFDNTTLGLSGTVSADAAPYNITVQAKDIYGDSTNATVFVDIISSIFNASVGTLNATIGSSFSFDLSVYLRQKSDVEMTARFPSSFSWLSYNTQNFILSGKVPESTKPSDIDITLSATSKSSKKTSTRSFKLSVISSSTPDATVTPSTNSNASGTEITSAAHARSSRRKKIILGTTIPLTILFIALLFALIYYLQRIRRAKRRSCTAPTKDIISAPVEANARVIQTAKPVYIPPKPLELDMSGFLDQSPRPSTEKKSIPPTPPRAAKYAIRRSQTMSVASGGRLSRITETDTSGMRSRVYSDNTISKTEASWRSTQEDSDVAADISASRTNSSKSRNTIPNHLARNYSNYSRKGHKRRSAMLFSQNPMEIMREAHAKSQQARNRESSVMGLGGGDFEVRNGGVESCSVMDRPRPSKRMGGVEHPNLYAPSNTRRSSGFMPSLGRTRSGIGHGGRDLESVSSSSGISKRRSIGHGQDYTLGRDLTRDSSTWLTVASGATSEQRRRSDASLLSRYSEELKALERFARTGIRTVSKSPSVLEKSNKSINSRTSRPVSRRMGDSPFFAASSISRASRRNAKRMTMSVTRTSFADSSTVPAECIMPSLEETILQGLREEGTDTGTGTATPAGETPMGATPARGHREMYGFGSTYSHAREGTRQLRNYLQNRLERPRTRESMMSVESRDSRFESAGVSEFSHDSRSPERMGVDDSYEVSVGGDEDEDLNWETYETRDSQGNLLDYGDEEPAVEIASIRPKVKANLVPGGRGRSSTPGPPIMDISANARMIPGRGRRPISGDAKHRKGSSMAVIERGTPEGDWRAYV